MKRGRRAEDDFTQLVAAVADATVMNDARLDHEKLDVYRCAVEFCRIALPLARRLPRYESELRSQLSRAAMSISLNIAEGAGKRTGPDRARFNTIARGSAMECGAAIDMCALSGYLNEADAQQAKELLVRIVSMLSKMCRP